MQGRVKEMKKCQIDLEELQAIDRVLRFVDSFLEKQHQATLITNGRSLLTWGELREHIKYLLLCRAFVKNLEDAPENNRGPKP